MKNSEKKKKGRNIPGGKKMTDTLLARGGPTKVLGGCSCFHVTKGVTSG